MENPLTARGWPLPHISNKLSEDNPRIVATLQAIDGDITDLEGRATATEAGVASNAAQVASHGGQLSGHASQLSALNSKTASNDTSLDTLQKAADRIKSTEAALATKADAEATAAALSGKASSSHTHTALQVAGGPAFSVYLSATQTVANGVAAKINLSAETFDTDNAFDSTTNYRFQPAVAGYYFFTGRLSGGASTAGTVMNAHLYKNGALVKNGQPYIPPSGSSSMTVTISGLVYLNGSTDYVELWGTNSGSGTNTFSGGAAVSYFDGYFVRP